ncbi:MAG TPA: succinyl-diaminopimelate desuccinylase [Acidimicrobiales bacterium]|nr:succinyl-diaminopimelate desuccinylase [Acidimicrobiales bacterium]
MTADIVRAPPPDLLALTAELVDIPSVSHHEAALADHLEAMLSGAAHLEVRRLGDNVLARTSLGRPMRLMLAGHLDTVPANGNARAVVEGDVCRGLGSADMKGGLAVMAELARRVTAPAVDVTLIAYVCEEVEQRHSGLGQIEAQAPDWLRADVAVLGEPTASVVEAGCQGVLRVEVELGGERAHTARPWMGVNALHRLGGVLSVVASYEARRPVIDGCEYREALQAVFVEGGVANNVVPDSARVVLNHRFAPDVSVEQAFAAVSELVEPLLDPALGDHLRLADSSLAAAPGLSHPLLRRLVTSSGVPPRAKLGWTDVSFFHARGVPAANFGPGEPTLAHSAGERVERADLERSYGALNELLTGGGI